MSISGENGSHILVFPFPTAGHIIPLLDLTNLFLTRGLTVTIIVTPTHLSLLDPLLSLHSSSLHPFLLEIPERPPTFIARMRALGKLSDPIVQWFQSHPSPPVAIISDFFLGWTNQLASNLGVSRVLFSPSGAMALSVFNCTWRDLPKNGDPANEEFSISFSEIPNSPVYPRWQVTHLPSQFIEGDPDWEFFRNGLVDNMASWGFVFNSFTELEGVYLDHVKKTAAHDRVWAVGPLLPSDVEPATRGGSSVVPPHEVMTWLDAKADGSVVYVCFGSRATLTRDQMNALAVALECSGVHFILCVKAVDEGQVDEIPDGFDDRVIGRGFIIRGWAPQVAILRHQAVSVFLTHCGWNSVLEAIAAGVMMLTWPTGADQFSNAKLLIDQLGIAAQACEGGKSTVPDSAKLGELLTDSVSESRPERVRVREMREASLKAVVNGGSSNKDLDMLVKELGELCFHRNKK
ncbi:hypothetical protein LguiA_028004 [Lonicera macranthoides]